MPQEWIAEMMRIATELHEHCKVSGLCTVTMHAHTATREQMQDLIQYGGKLHYTLNLQWVALRVEGVEIIFYGPLGVDLLKRPD